MNDEEQKIVIYESSDRKINLEVNLKDESVWLKQSQLSVLFEIDRSVIAKHFKNIFSSKELKEKSNVQKMHIANSDKPVKSYNLDAIISLGYRVNSKKATQFRIWSTSVLKGFIVNGYALNKEILLQKGLEELNQAVKLISNTAKSKQLSLDESRGLLEVISGYASSWMLLQKYDENSLKNVL